MRRFILLRRGVVFPKEAVRMEVRATSETRARELAAAAAHVEGKDVWLTEEGSMCEPMPSPTREMVLDVEVLP